MDKIQNLIPGILIETAERYAKVKEKECQNNNEQFRKKVVSSIKGCCRDIVMGSIIAILLIVGILFLKENE